jgi:hypothetical protein
MPNFKPFYSIGAVYRPSHRTVEWGIIADIIHLILMEPTPT